MTETMFQASVRMPVRAARTSLLSRVLASWQGRIGGGIVTFFTLMAVFAPWITPHSPTEVDFMSVMVVPTLEHPFGTDEVGRDILSRVILGARTSLLVVVAATLISSVAGAAIGLVAGWVGGWVDTLVMRVMDAMLAFPLIVLALAIIAVLGPSLTNAIIAIGIVKIPHFARLMRGEVLTLRTLDYIKAVETMGLGLPRILLRHVLPNAAGPVLVYMSIAASLALMTEASLSFLGLGIQPPTPSWGGMVSVGMQNWHFWWMSFYPGLAIFITVLAFNLLGDAIRDAMDRRLS
ncbi:MAG: ABC transporter permease [Rhodospirillum sp.]|nr:ABC transporter permease [Rhodospirillum sp.]MCF8489742.1 ABC transporter permease [Rhodospirillum sp.]